MRGHPRERAPHDSAGLLSRRELLRAAALAGGAAGLGAAGLWPSLAAAAASPTTSAASAATSATSATTASSPLPLPRPDAPVTWPVFPGLEPIKSGLPPERGATLKLYNWAAYINQRVVDNFARRYDCKVEITTFDTMEEAITKLRTGQLDFDVFFPTTDVIGELVEGRLLRALNHSYLSNMSEVWPDFRDPYYDRGWRYSVPYTIYTTGIAWRKDHVDENPYAMANPWTMPWQSRYKGRIAILDDYRESIALGLMKNGNFDLSTTSAPALHASVTSLEQLSSLVDVHIDNNDYSNVPSGQIWIHHAWSGDMAAAASYMPKGVPVEVVGYFFPTDGRGPVNNDTMVVLASGANPVLAHLFLDYLLDVQNALENISYNAYMQPLTAITPQRLVSEGILPPSLTSTAVLPSYFRRGIGEYALAPAVDAEWQADWLRVSGGL